MQGLILGGWVVPGDVELSMFLQRIVLNGGPMDGVFSQEEVHLLTEWISNGAKIERESVPAAMAVIGDKPAFMLDNLEAEEQRTKRELNPIH